MRALPRSFYARSTPVVARDLLGKTLVRRSGGRAVSCTISETEAYGHLGDPASHAHRGMTRRNRAMFGQVGCAYVYFVYGMHFCFNVVARAPGSRAGAVLVRAALPGAGAPTDGPAKLARALSIGMGQYGADLCRPGPLFIAGGFDGPARRAPRVGIRQATGRRWNFTLRQVSTGRYAPAGGPSRGAASAPPRRSSRPQTRRPPCTPRRDRRPLQGPAR